MSDNRCTCSCADYCPLGKSGMAYRCHADELRDKLRELIPQKEMEITSISLVEAERPE